MKEVTICDIFEGGWGSRILKKRLKTPPTYWGITIFSIFGVRVCQKVQFLKVSKKVWIFSIKFWLWFLCLRPPFLHKYVSYAPFWKAEVQSNLVQAQLGPLKYWKNNYDQLKFLQESLLKYVFVAWSFWNSGL